MIDHAEEAMGFASGKPRADLDSDRMLAITLTHLVEVVGEAANRVSESVQRAHPEVPWAQIVSARNFMIHGYDRVDHDILWSIVSADMPELVGKLRAILASTP